MPTQTRTSKGTSTTKKMPVSKASSPTATTSSSRTVSKAKQSASGTSSKSSSLKKAIDAEQVLAPEVIEDNSLLNRFVFMEKTIKALDIGLKTYKNLVLYGPGGHGKSELSLEFFYSKHINPYIITMGSGMTADRLLGGINIPVYEETGKIEYLIENSFMNHEFVIFEEMMDAPDFILEQLKDILSSKQFRNGSQVFNIKTKFIVGCTNKTRAEFAKNSSLKALMERFPLELNVVWDNYTEASYTTLLESRFGNVDPIIPFILEQYAKQGTIISPRIALDAYEIFEEEGPESLTLIAEFASKPNIISESLVQFKSTVEFKDKSAEATEILKDAKAMKVKNQQDFEAFLEKVKEFDRIINNIKKMKVNDNFVATHAAFIKSASTHRDRLSEILEEHRKKIVK